MADPVIVRNIQDAWILEARPTKNTSGVARLKHADASGSNQRMSYLYFGKPYPAGVNIVSAKLVVFNAGIWSGAVTITAERITSKWSVSRINFNNRPTAGGTAYTLSKTGAAAKTAWEIDITSMIQFVANGGAWYGIRLRVNGSTPRSLYSANAEDSDLRPYVVIEWSDAPETPETLNPSGNRAVSHGKPLLTFDFTDRVGDVSMAAANVQLSTVSNFASTVFDSGWVASTVPEYDLATSAYAGLAEGASIYWRVRVRDGSGLESGWSLPAQFRRVSKSALTLLNPAVSPNNFVQEATPPIIWDFAGTQTAYQVMIVNPALPSEIYWSSGKVTSTAETVTVEAGAIKDTTKTYRVVVQVWDNIDRQKEGDKPIWTEITRDFTYNTVVGVPGVTALAVNPELPYPWVNLTWTRSTAPDYYTIVRDGEVVATDLAPEDLLVSGTSYAYKDRGVSPRVPHTWQVRAVVNGQTSGTNTTVNLTTRPNVTWLMREDGSRPIAIVKSGSEPGPVVDAQNSSFQETHQPVGGGAPVLITQFLSGFEGHVEGVLSDGVATGLTARQMRDSFKVFKREKGKPLILYMVDETLRVIAYNMTYRPRAKSGGTILYDIAFDFFEDD